MNIENELKKLIVSSRNDIEIEQIRHDSDLILDFGYDSMSFIKLVVEMEDRFKVEFDDENMLMENISVFGDLLKVVINLSTK